MYLFSESVVEKFPEKSIFMVNDLGHSMLHTAIKARNIEMIRIIVSSNYGSQLLLQENKEGQTPLAYIEHLISQKMNRSDKSQVYAQFQSEIENQKQKIEEYALKKRSIKNSTLMYAEDSDYQILKCICRGLRRRLKERESNFSQFLFIDTKRNNFF